MTEREIREVLKQLCEELDRNARRAVRKVVLPSMLGAGLALSMGGCSDDVKALYSVPFDARVERKTPGPDAAYGLPFEKGVGDKKVTGPDAAYALPFDKKIGDVKKNDFGPTPPYMGPDLGPQPDYMAPIPDGGELYAVPLYAAPDSDAGKKA